MRNSILFTVLIVVAAFLFLFVALKMELTDVIYIMVLTATAWFIAKQVRATKRMVENQIRPSVDVSMMFSEDKQNKENSGTRFQFINVSKIPALVWIKIDLKIDGKEKNDLIDNEYLRGKKEIDIGSLSYITSAGFLKKLTSDEYEGKKIEIVLKTDIAPMFNKDVRFFSFQEKRYEFRNMEWIRMPFWGIADKIHPVLQSKGK